MHDSTKKLPERQVEIVGTADKFLTPTSIRDPETLAAFMKQPAEQIAAAVTGALSMGMMDFAQVAGRVVQGALKGKVMQQVALEIEDLIEKGQIKEDYASTKFGFKSLAELLEFLDSEVPDEDRLNGVKAMFWGINSVDSSEGEQILNYQLFQISKKLSGSQMLILRVCNDLRKSGASISSALEWFQVVAGKVGHSSKGLIERDEPFLMQEALITGRTASDRSGIIRRDARLTDLGIAFCERIAKYERIKSPAEKARS